MRFAVRSFAVLALMVGAALVSRADTYQFTFTPSAGSSADSFSFQAPSSPTPNSSGANFFELDVTMTFDGVTGSATFDPDTDSNGGLVIDPAGHASTIGFKSPVLFTGTPANPTFLLGEFNLTEIELDVDLGGGHMLQVNPGGPGVLDITDLSSPAPTPEPSTLVLFGTGLLGVAGAARRRFFCA